MCSMKLKMDRSILAWGLLSVGLLLHSPVHAATVSHLEITRGAVNYDGPHQDVLDRLLAQDGVMQMGRFQGVGDLVPTISRCDETSALFTSGFSGASAPSAVISDSSIKVDLSSLFSSVNRGNAYQLWNIGTVVTGLFNPTSKEFALSWDRVFDGNSQQAPASFFLNGLVHFDLDVQPVPLPAAAWLFMSGVAGVAALARRRKSE